MALDKDGVSKDTLFVKKKARHNGGYKAKAVHFMSPELEAIISRDRLETYLRAASFNTDRALALYAWNMKIGSSFMPLLGAAEVCLRNRISTRLMDQFGQAWWNDPQFHSLAGSKTKGIVKRAEMMIQSRGHPPDNGRMVAELSFGFWENMLLPKYGAAIWAQLHPHFPDLPSYVDQAGLQRQCGLIRDLRNRISHHEPIFGRNISQDYANCLELISWLSKAKADWIKPHCSVMTILRQKP